MEFPAFPYEPYSIQIDFMRSLYRFLDSGGVSMLESPTGICLTDFRRCFVLCIWILEMHLSFFKSP